MSPPCIPYNYVVVDRMNNHWDHYGFHCFDDDIDEAETDD